MLRHRQGAVRSIPYATVNRGSGGYYRTREITALRPVWNGCARKAGGLIQCLVSSRLTRPVQVRANSKIYAFRVALGTLLASCVRSDARRRQSRSFLSNGSDFDIAHRLESSMRSFARYRAYCRWPTPHTKTKRRPCEDPKACD